MKKIEGCTPDANRIMNGGVGDFCPLTHMPGSGMLVGRQRDHKPAVLVIGEGETAPRVWMEDEVMAMVDDIKVIAAENAMKAYTSRIEQMTPPAPVAFHIDNYMWKKHGITTPTPND